MVIQILCILVVRTEEDSEMERFKALYKPPLNTGSRYSMSQCMVALKYMYMVTLQDHINTLHHTTGYYITLVECSAVSMCNGYVWGAAPLQGANYTTDHRNPQNHNITDLAILTH